MALPITYTLDYSFTAFQQAQGNNTFPGTQIDNEFLAVQNSINSIETFIAGSFNPDGTLKISALPPGH